MYLPPASEAVCKQCGGMDDSRDLGTSYDSFLMLMSKEQWKANQAFTVLSAEDRMTDTEALASVITWLAGVVCSAKPEVAFP